MPHTVNMIHQQGRETANVDKRDHENAHMDGIKSCLISTGNNGRDQQNVGSALKEHAADQQEKQNQYKNEHGFLGKRATIAAICWGLIDGYSKAEHSGHHNEQA